MSEQKCLSCKATDKHLINCDFDSFGDPMGGYRSGTYCEDCLGRMQEEVHPTDHKLEKMYVSPILVNNSGISLEFEYRPNEIIITSAEPPASRELMEWVENIRKRLKGIDHHGRNTLGKTAHITATEARYFIAELEKLLPEEKP